MPTAFIDSIRAEYTRYKALAEGAIRQLSDAEVTGRGPDASNSIATICWHVSGNLQSRFTDFLTSDGEKPWRQREDEFLPRAVTRDALLSQWEAGWNALFSALAALTDEQLQSTVTIRQQSLTVLEALHRSLAHVAYHVGQIVYVAKAIRNHEWNYLSIPPGQSATYNQNPTLERPPAHAAGLSSRSSG